ncbi:hypothetical protein [Myceligenerans indicum]|uniref:WXG100 family type VII secretion target n=1 Tax=Myceligenerans indicum TaxID=2593663 RepID=A0ABS1LNV5_9MICO|nr:hypothetical protein [Myceligenerans indicum]MBL0887947.1 hypothetical protein [Myceligenerans indicum]
MAAVWQGLRESYRAPEAGQLYRVMDPVRDQAAQFADELRTVADALSHLAEDYREVVRRRGLLISQVEAFNGKVHPEWAGALVEVSDWVAGEKPAWQLSSLAVAEYNRLIAAMTKLRADQAEAEERCARKVRGLDGAARWGAATPGMWSASNIYNPAPQQALPWGPPVEHDWWDPLAPVTSLLKGVWVDGIWGGLQGPGAMVGLAGADAFGQTWAGVGELLGRDAETGDWWQAGAAGDAWLEMGKGLVAWDLWATDPMRAAGNVALLALPGLGAVRVVKTLRAVRGGARTTRGLDADGIRPNTRPGTGSGKILGVAGRVLDVATSDRALEVAARIDRAMDPLGTLTDAGFVSTRKLIDNLDLTGASRGSGDANPRPPAMGAAGETTVAASSTTTAGTTSDAASAATPDGRSGAAPMRQPDPQLVPDATQQAPTQPLTTDGVRSVDDNPLPRRNGPELASPPHMRDNDVVPSHSGDPAHFRVEGATAEARAGVLERDPVVVGGQEADTRLEHTDGQGGTPDQVGDGQDFSGVGRRDVAAGSGGDSSHGADGNGPAAGGRGHAGVADMEPVSWRGPDGRLVLSAGQQAAPDEFLGDVRRLEPEWTRVMSDVVTGHPGARLDETAGRFKPDQELYADLASGARRIEGVAATDLLAEAIDTVRYRVLAAPSDFTTSVQGVIDDLAEQGYRPVGALENLSLIHI